MNDSHETNLSDLSAYHDGELSAEESAKVKEALAHDPELQKALGQYAEITQALGNLPQLKAPSEIAGAISTRVRADQRSFEAPRSSRRPSLLSQVSSWAALFVVAAVGFLLSDSSKPQSESLLAKFGSKIQSENSDEANVDQSFLKNIQVEKETSTLGLSTDFEKRARTLEENSRSTRLSEGIPAPKSVELVASGKATEFYGRRGQASSEEIRFGPELDQSELDQSDIGVQSGLGSHFASIDSENTESNKPETFPIFLREEVNSIEVLKNRESNLIYSEDLGRWLKPPAPFFWKLDPWLPVWSWSEGKWVIDPNLPLIQLFPPPESPRRLLEQLIEVAVVDFAMDVEVDKRTGEFSWGVGETDQQQGLSNGVEEKEKAISAPPVVTIELSLPTIPKEWDATLGELKKTDTANQPSKDLEPPSTEVDRRRLATIARYLQSGGDPANSSVHDIGPRTLTLGFFTDRRRLPLLVKALELWKSSISVNPWNKIPKYGDGSTNAEENRANNRFEVAAGLTITTTADLLAHLDAEDAISMSQAKKSRSQSEQIQRDSTNSVGRSRSVKPKTELSKGSDESTPTAIQVIIRLVPEFLFYAPPEGVKPRDE